MTVGPEAGAMPLGSGGLRNVEFAQFFRAEHKRLIRFVMATGAGGDEAAEIAQVTFVKAFESWDVIRVPRAWIRRVAVNELAAARQAARRETPQAALQELPPRQRQVMAWIIDGFGSAEIACELGVSPESVRQSHAKARKNLGQFYGRRKKR